MSLDLGDPTRGRTVGCACALRVRDGDDHDRGIISQATVWPVMVASTDRVVKRCAHDWYTVSELGVEYFPRRTTAHRVDTVRSSGCP